MTTYFDDKATQIGEVQRCIAQLHRVGGPDGEAAVEVSNRLDAIENELVRDVTICAEWPGCPEQIRNAIHVIVLRYAPSHQPHNALNPVAPDYEDLDGHVRCIGDLCSALHTIFHDLASMSRHDRAPAFFTDSPLAPLHDLIGEGGHRRSRMLAPNLRWQRMALEGMAEEEAAPIVAEVVTWARDHAVAAGATEEQADAVAKAAERTLRTGEGL